MASYRQFCALAKALDVVGDRWTLLIMRELLGRGPVRYTDLLDGLPGIATNLLASRLRDLEEHGLVVKEAAPPPIATSLFRPTERAEALRPAIHALGDWGVTLLAQAPESDVLRGHWLSWPVEKALHDPDPSHPPTTIVLLEGDEAATIETNGGVVRTRGGTVENADLRLRGPRGIVIGAMMGSIPFEEAKRCGMQVEGDPNALLRLQAARR